MIFPPSSICLFDHVIIDIDQWQKIFEFIESFLLQNKIEFLKKEFHFECQKRFDEIHISKFDISITCDEKKSETYVELHRTTSILICPNFRKLFFKALEDQFGAFEPQKKDLSPPPPPPLPELDSLPLDELKNECVDYFDGMSSLISMSQSKYIDVSIEGLQGMLQMCDSIPTHYLNFSFFEDMKSKSNDKQSLFLYIKIFKKRFQDFFSCMKSSIAEFILQHTKEDLEKLEMDPDVVSFCLHEIPKLFPPTVPSSTWSVFGQYRGNTTTQSTTYLDELLNQCKELISHSSEKMYGKIHLI